MTISGIGGVNIARILFGGVYTDSDVRVAQWHKGKVSLFLGRVVHLMLQCVRVRACGCACMRVCGVCACARERAIAAVG